MRWWTVKRKKRDVGNAIIGFLNMFPFVVVAWGIAIALTVAGCYFLT